MAARFHELQGDSIGFCERADLIETSAVDRGMSHEPGLSSAHQ
jgi:hypothetical protein